MKSFLRKLKSLAIGLMYIAVNFTVALLVEIVFYIWLIAGLKQSLSEAANKALDVTYFLSAISTIFTIAVFLLIGKIRKKPLHSVLKKEPALPVIHIMAACLAIGLRFLVMVYCAVSFKVPILRDSIVAASEMSPQVETVGQQLVALFVIVVLGPYFEEILFRGLIMGGLLESFRPWSAIFIQALLFGAAHMSLFQSTFAFVIGIFLGAVYYRTRNLKTVILMHGVFNLSAAIPQIGFSVKSMVLFGTAGIVLCVCSSICIFSFAKRKD